MPLRSANFTYATHCLRSKQVREEKMKPQVKSQKKRKLKAPAKRQYNNVSRAEKSKLTQTSIIESYVELLVKNKGGEVHLGDVAKKTGISERTIFRFFEDKNALHAAMDEYLMSYLKASVEQMTASDFVGFAKNAYLLFDKYESLTMAYVLSPFGNQARTLFRKKLNLAMINKISQERKIALNEKNSRRLALVTSLVNSKIWYDLKTDSGYSGSDMTEAVDWALNTLLENI